MYKDDKQTLYDIRKKGQEIINEWIKILQDQKIMDKDFHDEESK